MTEEGAKRHPRLAYQPALDGVRAVAVLAVLLYHDALDRGIRGAARGGLLGVDAFFVLSGYLITTLLILERASAGRIDVRAFWARRARRLLPALFLLLLGVAAYAAFVAAPAERADIRGQGIATLFYVQNWFIIATHQRRSPLGHAWSLAIEEQWYFIWPPLLGFLLWWLRGKLGRVLIVVLAMTAVSVLIMWMLYDPGGGRSRVYRGTDTRAQALLVGAALAVLLQWRGGPKSFVMRLGVELAGIAGGIAFVAAVFRASGPHYFLYRGGFLLVAVAAGLVILAAIQPGSPVVRPVLSIPPLRALGLISYGVYLYHLPVNLWLSAERVGLSGNALLLFRTAVTIGLATASYFLVEMPIRRGALRGRPARVLLPVGAAVVCGALLLSTTGAEGGAPTDITAYRKAAAGPAATRVLVAGSASAVGITDDRVFTGSGIRGAVVGARGCGVVLGRPSVAGRAVKLPRACNGWPERYAQAAAGFDPAVAVLVVAADDVTERTVGGQRLAAESPALAEFVRAQLGRAVTALSGRGATVLLVTTSCRDTRAANARPSAWLDSLAEQFAGADAGRVRVEAGAAEPCTRAADRSTSVEAWEALAPLARAAARTERG